jgi:hypothetical protein
MLRASGEVSVGLNQGSVPPDCHWRVPGPTGVTGLVQVIMRGRPSRLELLAGDGRARAMLPWDWFAGWRCVDPG